MHPYKSFDVTLAATDCVLLWHPIVLVNKVLYGVNSVGRQLNELGNSCIVKHQLTLSVCNVCF